MKARILFILALIIGTWFAPTQQAAADTVLYDSSGLIQGAQSFTQSFNVTTPGTLTITLSQIPWFDTIKGLSCFVSTAGGVLQGVMNGGEETVALQSGTTIFAHWFGTADDKYKFGAYGIKIMFHPDNVVAVTLPSTLLLLVSGLGLIFGWQGRSDPLMANA
ncbi:MAG: hypothetical protein KGL92_08540 [Gammaproteobacteria bacterium]|nr:hypothetical protein [Gammaproteobacteria bacterium]